MLVFVFLSSNSSNRWSEAERLRNALPVHHVVVVVVIGGPEQFVIGEGGPQ